MANRTSGTGLLILFAVSFGFAYAQTASLVAKSTFPSVVMIQTKDEDGKALSLGSGFFVRPNIVATNYHVIKGASTASLKEIGNNKIYAIDGIVGIDKTNDLALLSIIGLTGKPLQLVTDLTKIDAGQDIFAVGNPQGLEGTISPGIISSKILRQIGRENLIQITAPISPGSSGGPVVNKMGQVIGVASASLVSGQNLNFAVPAAYISPLLNTGSAIMSFSEFADRDIPSLEETTDWLSKTLSGMRGQTMGDGFVSDTRLAFDGCRFRYYWEVPTNNGGLMSYTSTGSITDFEYVGSAPGSIDLRTDEDKAKPVMFLDLTFKSESIDSFASNSRRRDLDSRLKDSSIIIYLNDKGLQIKVGKAFRRLKGHCSKRGQ